MEKKDYPILEHDSDLSAVINPSAVVAHHKVPRLCVLCFFHEVIERLSDVGAIHQIGSLSSEIGPNPIYELVTQEQNVAIVHPGVGAPLSAGFLEEMIALGSRFLLPAAVREF